MGLWVEIVTLLIPGFNDSNDELQRLTEFVASVSVDIPWHVTAFHPDYKMNDRGATPVSKIVRAAEIDVFELIVSAEDVTRALRGAGLGASPVNSVADLIKLAKAKPGALNYASGGNGTILHLASAPFPSGDDRVLVFVPAGSFQKRKITGPVTGEPSAMSWVFVPYRVVGVDTGLRGIVRRVAPRVPIGVIR